MGIRFHCSNGHRLNVKSFLAGKRGYCPHCGVKVLIPEQPLEGSSHDDPFDSSPGPEPAPSSDSAIWYVRPPSGGQFGPAPTEVLNQWIAERRVPADALVWREGWSDWRPASEAFDEQGMANDPVPELDIRHNTVISRSKSSSGRFRAATVIVLGLAALVLLATLLLITTSRS